MHVRQLVEGLTHSMCSINASMETSLVVQGLRICLPMQQMWVQSLLWELRSHMLWGNLHAPEPTYYKEDPMATKWQLRPDAAK